MDSNTYGYGYQQYAQPDVFKIEKRRTNYRQPQNSDGNYFDTKWNGFMLLEIPYVCPQMFVPHELVIQSAGTAHVTKRSQQQKGCCRQNWQENP